MGEIGLVSCVKTKRDDPSVPKNLYTSPYFKKMRSYAEQYHDEWWILSAKHGLLDPDAGAIEPYNQTLTSATKKEKREWALGVVEQIEARGVLRDEPILVFHAGKDYYGELLPLLDDVPIQIPTEGLGFGEKLSWYNKRI